MKKILAIVLALAMVFALVACAAKEQAPAEQPAAAAAPAAEPAAAPAAEPAAAPAEKAPIYLGLLSGSSGTVWRDIMISDATELCDKYVAEGRIAGYKWAHNTNNGDATEQADLIRNFISDPDVNVIVVNPNSTDGLNGVIQEALDTGKLVVSADATVTAPGILNVTLDHYSWYLKTAEYVCDYLHTKYGGGNVIDIHGLDGHPADVLRENALDDTLAKYDDVKLIARESGQWDQTTAKTVATTMIASGQQIDGAFTQDGMGFGVLSAFLDAGKLPKVMFGDPGTAFYKEWKKLRDQGAEFTACSRPNPPGIMATGVALAVRQAEGKTIKADAVTAQDGYQIFYYQVGSFFDDSNFDEVYEQIKDKDDGYLLSEYITEEAADALFE